MPTWGWTDVAQVSKQLLIFSTLPLVAVVCSYLAIKDFYDIIPKDWGMWGLLAGQTIAVLFGVPSLMYCLVLSTLLPMLDAVGVAVAGHFAASVLILLTVRCLKVQLGESVKEQYESISCGDLPKCIVFRGIVVWQAAVKDYGLACAPASAYLLSSVVWMAVCAAKQMLLFQEILSTDTNWLLIAVYAAIWLIIDVMFLVIANYIDGKKNS